MSDEATITTPLREEAGILTRLATPMVVSQVGMLSMGLVDTLMVGRLGAEALGAVALGHVWAWGTLIIGVGMMMGIDPIVAQAHGSGNGPRAGRALQRALVLAVLLTIPIGGLWLTASPMLKLLGQDPELVHDAANYCLYHLFGITPYLAFTALRQYLQGRGLMIAPLVTILLANLLNVLFNWVLIFGNLGAPELGVRGAALATGLSKVSLFVILVAWIRFHRLHEGAWTPWTRAALVPAKMRDLLRFGVPIGAQFGLEVWAFNLAAIFAGWISTEALAAHTIVIRLASLSFMMPVGISIAAATRIGNLIGARQRRRAQDSAWVAITMGGLVMAVWAILFWVFRRDLTALFTADTAVIALGAVALPIAAAFQLFDGVQCVASGVLRGMGTTRPAAAFGLVGFYGIALPLAYLFAFELDGGLAGIWWGLCAGLGAVAVMLMLWVLRRGPMHGTVPELTHDADDDLHPPPPEAATP